MYLFYNLFTALHVSNYHFVHPQEFINLLYQQLCINRANVSNCSVLQLNHLHGLYRAADTVNHELLMIDEMVVRNM